MAAQFGYPRQSSVCSERRGSEKSEKKARKVSAAEAYWSDPVMSAGFGAIEAPRPSKSEKKSKKAGITETYWNDAGLAWGFGPINNPSRI